MNLPQLFSLNALEQYGIEEMLVDSVFLSSLKTWGGTWELY